MSVRYGSDASIEFNNKEAYNFVKSFVGPNELRLRNTGEIINIFYSAKFLKALSLVGYLEENLKVSFSDDKLCICFDYYDTYDGMQGLAAAVTMLTSMKYSKAEFKLEFSDYSEDNDFFDHYYFTVQNGNVKSYLKKHIEYDDCLEEFHETKTTKTYYPKERILDQYILDLKPSAMAKTDVDDYLFKKLLSILETKAYWEEYEKKRQEVFDRYFNFEKLSDKELEILEDY